MYLTITTKHTVEYKNYFKFINSPICEFYYSFKLFMFFFQDTVSIVDTNSLKFKIWQPKLILLTK